VDILPRREARAFVPENQLSLAIGRGGQNVRLAAKLTGWKIDVRSQSHPDEVQEGGTAAAIEAENAARAEKDEKEDIIG
jgi:N utilization substance protein A